MKYPVIIIPTLCRYEHLKKCIDSLLRCTRAEETDVVIGLDYPAKESHFAGYVKISEYLKNVQGFHNLIILKHDKNLGASRNVAFIMEYARKFYDSYIYMEDDCEVSPNFLEYIYKGLVKFEGDSSVVALCGYSYNSSFDCGESNFYLERAGFSAWGYAITFKNRDMILNTLTRWYSIRKILNPFSLIHTAWYSWSSLLFLFMHAIKPTLHTDYVLSNYLLFEHKNMVMPRLSLVRNNGFDGSGEHCNNVEGYSTAQIDTQRTFDFIGTGKENYWIIDKWLRQSKRSCMSFGKMIRHIVAMFSVRVKRCFTKKDK